jgi:hypothetical protein
MEISNQKKSKQIKRTFNLIGICIVIVGLILLWLKKDIAFFITAGIFAAYIGIAQYANLCFVNFSTDNGRIRIKYYPVVSILKKEYESIEFAHQALFQFDIENSMGFSDLSIAIKTKRGIAEYPSISLAAMSKTEIDQIRIALTEILQKNRGGV